MNGELWPYQHYLRRNLAAVASWELVWGFGAAGISNSIILAFLAQLTESKALIGALNVTYLLALPGLLIASYLNQRLRSRRAVVAGLHALQVSAWLAVGLITLLAGDRLGSSLVYLVFAAHSYIYVVNGFLVAPTYELLSGVFEQRWGMAQGVQVFVNRLSGTAGGLAAAALLATVAFPSNFGWTFVIAGLCLVLSNVSVLFLIEPPPRPPAQRQPLLPYLFNLGRLIRRDRPFCLLLIVTGVIASIQMVQGFYVVFALERLHLDPSYAGIFVAITFATNGIGGLILGPLGDRVGHRLVMLWSLGLHVLSFVAVIVMQSAVEFYLALGISSIGTMGAAIAQANLAVGFAPAGEKGAYSALTRLVTAPATALSMLLAGLSIDLVGFAGVFAASLLLPLAGIVATLRFADPRHVAQPVR
ncbi:MAG: MFS transporter [Chloroflexi bacterium]|nr:MFS transporter [Chloroflexota bacterium]